MRTVLLVGNDEALRARLARSLDGSSVFSADTDDSGLRTLRMTPVELIEAADFVLLQPFTTRHLQAVLRQATEKLHLLQEVVALRGSHAAVGGGSDFAESATPDDVGAGSPGHVVKEFAKALSAGFDLPRLLDLFLDAVGAMTQPSKSAILLADPNGRRYRVAANRGLAPHVVESVSLAADGGLASWLTTEGRLIRLEEAQAHPADRTAREVAGDLAVLQAVIGVPLMSHGELVAILTLGRRVTGGAYSRRETEMLWSLATNMATAIRHIRIHHLLQYQKEFAERILAHMANGVITIGADERVVIMNRRAEEILGLAARDVLHRDLRTLPSPLGDMLFEALSRSRGVNREEVHLAWRRLPLEVSTYPVLGDGFAPLGAVLLFEDLTNQRQVAREHREAEQLQLLTRVVARVADEIKNPLVSIRTFMELLEERYDDTAFRHHFASVVGRDVRRLVQRLETLTTLANEGPYKVESVNARTVVEDCLAELGAQPALGAREDASLLTFSDESTQKQVSATFSAEGSSFIVRGDRTMLARAVSYLISYLLRRTPEQDAKLAVSIARLEKEDRVRITVASRTADVRADELRGIFDPIQAVQESLIDVGPCVSQRIVEAQGGRLEVRHSRSEVSFSITLPGAGA